MTAEVVQIALFAALRYGKLGKARKLHAQLCKLEAAMVKR